MCGICGRITFDRGSLSQDVVAEMVGFLAHRGPDDQGVYLGDFEVCGKSFKVGLGHRRLSVIDPSQEGHQPMTNEDKTVWVVYNGEVYNFKGLRRQLKDHGHIFKSHTDTEVIVHLYEDYGLECIKRLEGMFALAIWDTRRKRLLLARDRLGQKPLLYHFDNKGIIFASETRSLLAGEGERPSVNKQSIDAYLTYGYIPAPATIFSGINKLLPGHILVWQAGRTDIEIFAYWRLSFSSRADLKEREYCSHLEELFSASVKSRLVSDVPLGVFLSGGFDSSAIVATAVKLSSTRLKTFSIGFKERSFDELEYARLVARRFDTEHYEFIVEPKGIDVLPKLVECLGEPFADSSIIPTYYLSLWTKKSVTVALSGDGGDELFAGYDRYKAEAFRRRLFFLSWLDLFVKKIPEPTVKKGVIKPLKRLFNTLAMPANEAYLSLISIFTPAEKDRLYRPEFGHKVDRDNAGSFINNLYRHCRGYDFLTSTLYVDTLSYLPNDLLVKTDIASMANGLEVRCPFLDHKLVEFAASIPSSLKLRRFASKYILKKTFNKTLPKVICKRPKAGFGLPIGFWFRNKLKDFIYDLLLDGRSIGRGYFEFRAIKAMLDEHASGRFDRSKHIWALLVLEIWHRKFVD